MFQAALIGLGNIAWKLKKSDPHSSSLSHKDAYDSNTETTLTCGYSPDPSEADLFSRETGITAYTDLDKMFESEKIDIVSICSPNHFHSQHLSYCCNLNIPMIWLEKPVRDCTHANNEPTHIHCGSKVLVNLQRRYTQSYQRLKQAIIEEHFGSILKVEIHYSRGLETNGIHMLDMLFYLLDVEEIETLWIQDDDTDNPDFILRARPNILIHASGIDAQYHDIDLIITFETGRLSILHGGMTTRTEAMKEHELFPDFYRLKEIEDNPLGMAGFGDAFDHALTDLIDSYKKDREPISSLDSALLSQNLLESIMKHSGS